MKKPQHDVMLAMLFTALPAQASDWRTISAVAVVTIGIALASAWIVVKRSPKITQTPLKILLFSLIFWPVIFAEGILAALWHYIHH